MAQPRRDHLLVVERGHQPAEHLHAGIVFRHRQPPAEALAAELYETPLPARIEAPHAL